MRDGYRILVVEDNELNLKLVRDVLTYAGYDVVEARTGEQGVALATERLPDLVLMDLQLPGIDGAEALRQMRSSPQHADSACRGRHRLRDERGSGTGDQLWIRRLFGEADQCP